MPGMRCNQAAPEKKAPANATREEGRTVGAKLRPSGTGYAFVVSEMEFDGKRIADVGIRFREIHPTELRLRRCAGRMKVDFDRFVEAPGLRGSNRSI